MIGPKASRICGRPFPLNCGVVSDTPTTPWSYRPCFAWEFPHGHPACGPWQCVSSEASASVFGQCAVPPGRRAAPSSPGRSDSSGGAVGWPTGAHWACAPNRSAPERSRHTRFLFRRFIELLPILFDALPGEVQLSQAVGSAGVALRRRFSIPGYRLAHLVLTFQKFPQCVLCEVISCVSRPLIVWENAAPVCAAFCGARRPSTV